MRKVFWSGWVFLFLFIAVCPQAFPQVRAEKKSSSKFFKLEETEILGKLPDFGGRHRLLETEIMGTLERPRMNFFLPWQDPESIRSEESGKKEVFKEIYRPIDRDTFIRQIEILSP